MSDLPDNFFPAMINRLSERPDNPDFGKWFEANLDVMEKRFDSVRELLEKEVNDVNFNTAINAIYFMIDKIPLMMTRLEPNAPIFRARPNYGELFSEQEEISYNSRNTRYIQSGRFNRPLEPLFYGALRVDNPKTDAVLTCCLESCKALTDRDNPVQLQDMTVGRWLTRDLLPVINLCFDERHLAGNAILKKMANGYQEEMSGFFSAAASDFIFRFMKFFSELGWAVNEHGNHYYVLNAFFYAVRYYYSELLNTPIPGVIYPSAMMEAHGLNIVLVPQAVDRFLKLDKVMMQRFALLPGTKTFNSMPCSELLTPVDGRFKFKQVQPYWDNGQLFYYP